MIKSISLNSEVRIPKNDGLDYGIVHGSVAWSWFWLGQRVSEDGTTVDKIEVGEKGAVIALSTGDAIYVNQSAIVGVVVSNP